MSPSRIPYSFNGPEDNDQNINIQQVTSNIGTTRKPSCTDAADQMPFHAVAQQLRFWCYGDMRDFFAVFCAVPQIYCVMVTMVTMTMSFHN